MRTEGSRTAFGDRAVRLHRLPDAAPAAGQVRDEIGEPIHGGARFAHLSIVASTAARTEEVALPVDVVRDTPEELPQTLARDGGANRVASYQKCPECPNRRS